MRRKGQLAVVLIMLAFIAFSGIVMYMAYYRSQQAAYDNDLKTSGNVAKNARVFQFYVSACLQSVTMDALELAGKQGGYIFDDQTAGGYPLKRTSNTTPKMITLFDTLNESANFSENFEGETLEEVYEQYNITKDMSVYQQVYVKTVQERGITYHIPYFITVDPNDPPLPIYPCKEMISKRHYCNFNSNISLYPDAATMRYGLKHMLALDPIDALLTNGTVIERNATLALARIANAPFQINYSVRRLVEAYIEDHVDECIRSFPTHASFEVVLEGKTDANVTFGVEDTNVHAHVPNKLVFQYSEAVAAPTEYDITITIPFRSLYLALNDSVDYDITYPEFRLRMDTMAGTFSYYNFGDNDTVKRFTATLRSASVPGFSMDFVNDYTAYDDMVSFSVPRRDASERYAIRFLRQNRPPVLNWIGVPPEFQKEGVMKEPKMFGEIGADKGAYVSTKNNQLFMAAMPGRVTSKKRDADVLFAVQRQRFQPVVMFGPPSGYDPDEDITYYSFSGWLVDSRGIAPFNSTFTYGMGPAQIKTNKNKIRSSSVSDDEYLDMHTIKFETYHKRKTDGHFDCIADNCDTCLNDPCYSDPDSCGDPKEIPINKSFYEDPGGAFDENFTIALSRLEVLNTTYFLAIPLSEDNMEFQEDMSDVLDSFFHTWTEKPAVAQNFSALFEEMIALNMNVDIPTLIKNNATALLERKYELSGALTQLQRDIYEYAIFYGVRTPQSTAVYSLAADIVAKLEDTSSKLRGARVLAQQGEYEKALHLLDVGSAELDAYRALILEAVRTPTSMTGAPEEYTWDEN